MIARNYILSTLTVCVLAILASAPAHAQRVGEAAVVQNEVIKGGSQINVGDAVLRNETVRTGANSATRLVMINSTNLSLGANSSITIDRTVFNDEQSYRDVTIRLTTGAFRFVTGHSDKNAYKITTGLATIGVRGTILDILSQRGKSTVVLQDGAARVCTLSFQCVDLHQARRHRRDHLVQRQGDDPEDQQSALDLCHEAAARRLACAAPPQYAGATPTVIPVVDDGSDPTGMLCGR